MIGILGIIYFIGFLGTIISCISITLSKARNNKRLKKIWTRLLILFIFMLVIGIVGDKYFAPKSSNQVNANVQQEITSGNSTDPVVITVKDFFVNDITGNSFIQCDISIKNNTKYNLIVGMTLDYDDCYMDGGGEIHLSSKSAVGSNYTTPFMTYYSSESDIDKKLVIHNLTKATVDYCIVKINGGDKQLSMDELKQLVNSNK
ncbi:hypothetical protein ACJDU8_02360 [Clostridium sp. WILCCON 0269]|uniref:DUF4352 domain-containing protein n=1 Tax=Candidatus Clostridium eludens TaxID=3381663 RepID=A0ABW8SEG9_9CLOT